MVVTFLYYTITKVARKKINQIYPKWKFKQLSEAVASQFGFRKKFISL